MAKAETSPTAISWPPEGLPIDVACKSIMPPLWAAYVKAQDAARGVDDLLSRIRILSLGADRERLLAEREAGNFAARLGKPRKILGGQSLQGKTAFPRLNQQALVLLLEQMNAAGQIAKGAPQTDEA